MRMTPVDSATRPRSPDRGQKPAGPLIAAQRGMPAPAVAKPPADDTGTVRTGTLGRLQDLVTALGGDAPALLGKSQIDAALLADENGTVAYRSLAQVMEHA